MTEQPAATPEAPDAAQKRKKRELTAETRQAIKLCREGNELYAEDIQAAAAKYREAVQVDPEYIEGFYNLGVALRDLEQNEEATKTFEHVIEMQDLAPKAFNNLALLQCRTQDWDGAEANYRKAIEQHFQYATAHFNLGMLLCRLGRYEEGFRECEWRWQTPEFTPVRCLQTRWTGNPFAGTLLVHTEQGIGDTIQFMRFLPEIRKRVGKMILFCPENLHCLFDESKAVDDLRDPGQLDLGDFQHYLPLMSAPFALGTTLDSIPNESPYLFPEQRTVDLGPSHVPDAKLKVGISWGGSPTHAYDKHRSCKLEALSPLLDVPGVAFYSLQMGPQVDQIQQLSPEHQAKIRDVADLQKDMADAAAIVKQLDLVISVDTAVIHLTGALACPGWALLAVNADWRWLEDREDTPWYPSLKLFRQRQLDDWGELVGRVKTALEAEVGKRG
ncbi:MAG: glycosyltransferase [Planctomycetota bacterium]